MGGAKAILAARTDDRRRENRICVAAAKRAFYRYPDRSRSKAPQGRITDPSKRPTLSQRLPRAATPHLVRRMTTCSSTRLQAGALVRGQRRRKKRARLRARGSGAEPWPGAPRVRRQEDVEVRGRVLEERRVERAQCRRSGLPGDRLRRGPEDLAPGLQQARPCGSAAASARGRTGASVQTRKRSGSADPACRQSARRDRAVDEGVARGARVRATSSAVRGAAAPRRGGDDGVRVAGAAPE